MKSIVKGKVVRGEGIGKKNGYPTANLDHDYFNSHPLTTGVYAAWSEIDGKRYQCLVVVGVPFTKQRDDFKIEVHLLNFKGDLRNRYLSAEIVEKLRPIKFYSDPEELMKQIEDDIKQTKKLLK